MKKKNILLAAGSLALVACLTVGATLAYFTSKDTAANTFTMGNVAIDLKESNGSKDANGDKIWVDDGLSYTNMMPGDTADKEAKVTVASTSADCYVRVTVAITTPEGSTLTAADITSLYAAVTNAISTTDWTVTAQADGTLSCVFNSVAQANEVLTLFNSVTLPTTLGNNAANQSFSIVLNAYAVQSDNVNISTLDWSTLTFDKTN